MLRDEPLEKEGPVPHLGRRDPWRSQAGEGGGVLESALEGWMMAVGRPRGGKRDIKIQGHRDREVRAIERQEEKKGRELADPGG